MENNFDNRDFEQFVKQNADQYRMFPSENVWKNIHHTLHTRRRWYGVGLIVLLLTAGIVTWVMLSTSVRNNGPLAYRPASVSHQGPTENKNAGIPILIVASKPADNKSRFITKTENLQENLFISAPENSLTVSDAGAAENEQNSVSSLLTSVHEPVVISAMPTHIELPAKHKVVYNKQPMTEKPASADMAILTPVNTSSPSIEDKENKKTGKNLPEMKIAVEKRDIYPLTIESVVNSYKHQRHGKKLSWEIFITPTVSYRKLSENKVFINSVLANNNVYNPTSAASINSLVTHKPDMGLQGGISAGYPIFKNLKIIGGFQFNVSKYDIRASFSTGEVATIALNTGLGANSVSTISNYRNYGTKADWLRNLYFSASVPVGLELKLAGNKKNKLGITGTIQPTYILSNRAYLLSTDYKNYVEVPSLIRKWNMNTSFEIFAEHTTGKVSWRVGPLVRYQLRSSFMEQYPVEEHLFDFGLKMGIMLKK